MSLSAKLEKKFRADIRFRGQAYVKAERVVITRATADELFGVVKDETEFHTQLTRRDDTMLMSCSCANGHGTPHEVRCRHVWATILFAEKSGYLDSTGALIRRLSTDDNSGLRDAKNRVKKHDRCRMCLRLSEPQAPTENWLLEFGVVFDDDPSVFIKTDSPFFSSLTKQRQDAALAEARLVEEWYQHWPWRAFWLAGITTDCHPQTKRIRPINSAYISISDVAVLIRNRLYFRGNQIRLLLPARLRKAYRTRRRSRRIVVRMEASEDNRLQTQSLNADALLSVRPEMVVDDKTLTSEEIHLMAQLKTPLISIRGEWFFFAPPDSDIPRSNVNEVDIDEVSRIAKLVLNLQTGGGYNDAIIAELLSDYSASPRIRIDIDSSLQEFIDGFVKKENIPLAPAPRSLNGELRHYQLDGYSWLVFLSEHRRGACLADDMGLGKTLQTIAWLLRSKEQGNTKPSLLICPTSLMWNWEAEIAKFAPTLRCDKHHGPNRSDDEFQLREQAQRNDLIITTYNLFTRDKALFYSVPWHAVILDEAQNIKNHETKQSSAVCDPALTKDSSFRLALTGTPIENHLGDLWPIMQFLNPGLLGTYANFAAQFNKSGTLGYSHKSLSRLKERVQPFILRRMKSDPKIAPDLPQKIETPVYCSLTREQAEWYQSVLNELERSLACNEQRWGAVLKAITGLKQICNHPALFAKDSSELEGRSGKLKCLVELLEQVLEAKEQVLIFTQYAQMAKLLREALESQFKLSVSLLTGELTPIERKTVAETFQSATTSPILVATQKVGGVGLNLTAASHVVHFDRWWNPAVEDQATDRAYRIGQKRNVHVHKFICRGTLEERISQMLDDKRRLSEEVLSDQSLATTICNLNDEERRSFLQLGDDAICDD